MICPDLIRKNSSISSEVSHVVKNEQPPVVGPSLAQGRHDFTDRVVYRKRRQVHPLGQVGDRRAHDGRLFGGDPADQVVVLLVPVYVLDGQMCLADTAVTMQCVRDQGRRFPGEPLVHVEQKVVTTGEMRVLRRNADQKG